MSNTRKHNTRRRARTVEELESNIAKRKTKILAKKQAPQPEKLLAEVKSNGEKEEQNEDDELASQISLSTEEQAILSSDETSDGDNNVEDLEDPPVSEVATNSNLRSIGLEEKKTKKLKVKPLFDINDTVELKGKRVGVVSSKAYYDQMWTSCSKLRILRAGQAIGLQQSKELFVVVGFTQIGFSNKEKLLSKVNIVASGVGPAMETKIFLTKDQSLIRNHTQKGSCAKIKSKKIIQKKGSAPPSKETPLFYYINPLDVTLHTEILDEELVTSKLARFQAQFSKQAKVKVESAEAKLTPYKKRKVRNLPIKYN